MKIITFLIFILCYHNIQAQGGWPRLTKNLDDNKCRQALKIAEKVFQSDSLRISNDVVPNLPEDIDSKLALEITRIEKYKPPVITPLRIFKKLPRKIENEGGWNDTWEYYKFIYWQSIPINKQRIVLDVQPCKYEIPYYSLHLISEEMLFDEFSQRASGIRHYKELKPLFEGYSAPIILEDQVTQELWVIDTKHPYSLWSSWDVLSLQEGQIVQICTIEFRPNAHKPADLLPKEVAKFANLLDIALGHNTTWCSDDEFMYIRAQLKHILINIAMRPHALTQVYLRSTREQVDIGLKKWSQKNSFNGKLYNKILLQYHKAEQSLIKYYCIEFNKTKREATKMAKYAIDILFTSHFNFNHF